MKMFILTPSTTALSAFLALASIAPAQAAPVQVVRPPDIQTIKMVQYKPHAGSWHGYQGFRTERPGTRRHSDGYWYPLAAFGVEPGTTGSIVRQPVNRPAARKCATLRFPDRSAPAACPAITAIEPANERGGDEPPLSQSSGRSHIRDLHFGAVVCDRSPS
ncbi:hypothetical protein Rleg9DRAFT_3282 [Rhizobium leguminosarum bv. trifolii WSM597]|uniref:Cell surface protein n=1 Tax=Rhizobium leguminosarum bv. trifolii WSM597 TaxID=754764 RepID=I9N943_RHILT|nr:hypothetical protein Rleg9DRAFT_3282 [Rhizobium leguminosarum bv. trifolii WSM597]